MPKAHRDHLQSAELDADFDRSKTSLLKGQSSYDLAAHVGRTRQYQMLRIIRLTADWLAACLGGASIVLLQGWHAFEEYDSVLVRSSVGLPTLILILVLFATRLRTVENHDRRGSNQQIMVATLISMGIVCILGVFLDFPVSRSLLVATTVLCALLLYVERAIVFSSVERLRRNGRLTSPVIVAGSPAHIDDIAQVLRRERWLGYEVIGAVTPTDLDETPSGLPVLGRVAEVVDLVRFTAVDSVIFAEGSFPDSQHFKRMAWELEELDVQMIVVPALTDISSERLNPRPVAGLPLVYVERPKAMEASRWSKRAFDIVGSGLLLLIAAPIIAAVAIAIKLEDRGPVFFKQVRVGLRGEEFECLMIRSMVVDAEARKAALNALDPSDGGVLFKLSRDPRITRVGQFIRRFSLDELPRLWNVWRGDMSLVGPRPARPVEVAQYDRDAVRRLDVRPGLTGLWQVSGRSDLSWGETVRLDVYYVDNWSIVQDLSILMRTAGAILGSRGSY